MLTARLLIAAAAALPALDHPKFDRPPTQEEMKKMYDQRNSDDGAPEVGDVAPTFKLKTKDRKTEWDLASFRGKKPVVLFFGSYT